MSLLKNPFQVFRLVLTVPLIKGLQIQNISTFKMSPFSVINYSFSTKALSTGQWNYQGKLTSERWSD